MYPRDNIFNIYYNIGRRLPFQVKRCEMGLARSKDKKTMYSQNGRSFLVERIEHGKAYGKCFVDGVPNNEYREQCYPNITDDEIPCAGCGEWVLLEVPGVDMKEIFPCRTPDYIIAFGKYKGKTIQEIYQQDPKYIFWLLEKDYYFKIDFDKLLNIPHGSPNRQSIIENEINRVFPKTRSDDLITFGKYKGKNFKEVYETDPNYINWFLRNNKTLAIDVDSFALMMKQKVSDAKS